MQPVTKNRAQRIGGVLGRARALVGREVAFGAGIVLLVVFALVTTAVLYANPPGRMSFSFRTDDASSIDIGQDVRVAGIGVGTVTDVSIEPDAVLVTAEIDDAVPVGSDSRVEVRMLTPVGGYAITLVPLGVLPLGDTPLPVEQVSVPYSIGDVLQAAPHTTDNVEGGTVDANLDEMARALEENPTSIASMISGLTSIARVMDQQRAQVRTIADLAAEYLQSFEADQGMVFDLIREIDVVLSTYNTTHAGFNEAYSLLGNVLMTIQPFEAFYLDHKTEVLDAVNHAKGVIDEFRTSMGPAIDNLQSLRTQLAEWLTPEGMAAIKGGTLMASDFCVPVPGRTC
ncbi:MlaD family protein [Rhodococcus koreensis]|uniref:MlaD family protein n=1 Tax=Rhodococcus koreensis TaxID=99653 RepID=UPI0036DA0A7C